MALQEKTLKLIIEVKNILEEHNPMTLRQIYYQLVSKQVIENKRNAYVRLSNALVKARQERLIPWEWIEDRTRKPRDVSMWNDLQDFINTVKRAYRRDVWENQKQYILVWLEKDALSGIFEEITEQYGVTLIVGRGYNSWSVKKDVARRLTSIKKPTVILYFGDFDPSGEDIYRDLEESLKFFGLLPGWDFIVEKVALTKEDVINYQLPPDFTKRTDTRAKKFIEKNGDMAVELDALPIDILQEKIENSIIENMDIEALKEVEAKERKERERLSKLDL